MIRLLSTYIQIATITSGSTQTSIRLSGIGWYPKICRSTQYASGHISTHRTAVSADFSGALGISRPHSIIQTAIAGKSDHHRVGILVCGAFEQPAGEGDRHLEDHAQIEQPLLAEPSRPLHHDESDREEEDAERSDAQDRDAPMPPQIPAAACARSPSAPPT